MAKFKVISVKKQERLRPDGGVASVYRVWIETSAGSEAAVDVPASVYESDDLKAFLVKQAEMLDRALTLEFD